MLQRTQNAAFLGGAYVFPGGSLDPQDSDMHRVVGLTENDRVAGVGSGVPVTSTARTANVWAPSLRL